MAGIWFIICGLLIRMWANGYAIKMEKLTTSGPYAFVRHPLYLGTMLLVIGFIIMLKIYYLGILLFFTVVIVYSKTIKKEEEMLKDKFKDLFINYKKRVPAIVPTIFPYAEGEKWAFSLGRLIRSQEYKLFIWIIVITIVFHLKDEIFFEHKKIDSSVWRLIIVAIILIFTDLFGEFIKWRMKKKAGHRA
jgi:hypothetical protein